jgi:hypothetical protein
MRELTQAEYERLNGRPRRRFRVFEVSSARVRLRAPAPAPCYWFERNDVGQEHPSGRYLRAPEMATVSLLVDGKISAFFYLAGTRLATCTFAYDLTAPQLERAVVAMRRAKLTRLIRPAAEWALREMPAVRRPVLEVPLTKLLGDRRRAAASSRRRRTTR